MFALAASTASAMAMGKPVSAPEIDGAAGISAIALLLAVGVMAHNRLKS